MAEISIPARLYRAGGILRADDPAAPAKADGPGAADDPADLAGADDPAERRLRLSFSSELPVARDFGLEILGHGAGEVDLSRLAAGVMPLLTDHRASLADQVGTVESAGIEGGRGIAVVRFGKSARAAEILARVRDGEITGVSVGYRIDRATRAGERDGIPVFRATRWTPLEISLVAMPADETVGIGRAASTDTITLTLEGDRMTTETIPAAAETVATRAAEATAPDQVGPERARIRDISALGRRFKLPEAEVERAIDAGTPVAEFQRKVLDHLGSGDQTAIRDTAAKVGLTEREARRYSLVNAINYLAAPTDARARAAAAFEIEVSEAAAERSRTTPKGLLVPADVLSRADFAAGKRAADLTAGTASAGGATVATELLTGSFIDLLRRKSAIMRANPTVLGGLSGNVAIPRQTGGATAYWVGEDTAPPQSGAAFDQVTMTPKTVGAISEISRKLLLQSSVDVEAMVRRDLVTGVALEVDGVAMNGSTDTDAPSGLKDYAANINAVDFAAAGAPTWAELVAMETAIAADDADVESMAYIFNAGLRGYLKQTPKVAGHPIFLMGDDKLVNGYGSIVSNQAEAGDLWLGNWADFVIGMWSGLDLTVDPYTAAATGAVRVIAHQDVDFAIRHPESFCYGRAIA
ncbi:phage major capsid protein [Amaricoccus solimangrovi]|uniref:Phage major capsid protein n=1 Tax=Amaricoccus solimangrovi TaxID=2589815 RepID=A0A501X0T1_9RHOB|nr:phage major capsid protein [Amaricoccus solimangrovi]TPE52596.1 phage major capsid protein [Amaricoccus solimangrovi]